jgi:DNA helicase-2/ATP-dependent DNA helicase PcrA
VVFVIHASDACIPSDMATGTTEEIDEERRLLYVAMTRAKDQLDILVPQRFYVAQQAGLGDRHVYGSRTRFIPNRLLGLFEQVSWPIAEATTSGNPQSRQNAIDLAARMRAMWQQ